MTDDLEAYSEAVFAGVDAEQRRRLANEVRPLVARLEDLYDSTDAGFVVEDPLAAAQSILDDLVDRLDPTEWTPTDDPIRVVTLTIDGPRQASFPCPGYECRRKVSVKAAYPFGWRYVTCRGCKATWSNWRWNFGPDGAREQALQMRRADDLPVGYAEQFKVFNR